MPVDFEKIQCALFERLKSALGQEIRLATRREITFADPNNEQRPAMMLLVEDTRGIRHPGCATIWELRSSLTLFVTPPIDTKLSVEPILHKLLLLADKALARQPNELGPDDDPGTTLGGLVYECWRSEHAFHPVNQQGPAALSCSIQMKVNDQFP